MAIQNKQQSMANRLIQGAGKVYGGAAQIQMQAARRPGYNPSAQNNINQGIIQANRMNQYKKMQNDRMVANYIDQIPKDFDVSQTPVSERPVIKDFLAGQREEARILITKYLSGAYDPQQPEYIEAENKLNGIKQKVQVLQQGLLNKGKGTEEYLKDYSDKNFSDANDPDGMMNLSMLYTNKYQLTVDPETGSPMWNGQTYNDHVKKQPFNKAYEEAGKFTSWSQKMYSAGVPMNDATKIMYGNEISLMLDKGGWEATRSLVKDNILGKNFLAGQEDAVNQLIEQGNSDNPEIAYPAREQLNNLLKDQMLNKLDEMAIAGQTQNNSKLNNNPGETSPILENEQGDSEIDSWLGTFERGVETFKPVYDDNGALIGSEPVKGAYVEPPTVDDWNVELMGTDFGIVGGGGKTYNIDGVDYDSSTLDALIQKKLGASRYKKFMESENKQEQLKKMFPTITSSSGGAYIQYLGGNADERGARQFPVDLADPDKINALLKRLKAKIK
jgi:hypothetical protein